MKLTYALLVLPAMTAIGAQDFRDADPADAVCLSVRSSDHMYIRNEERRLDSESTETDALWRQRLSLALVFARLGTPTTCLCSGWRTIYLYSKGKPIGSLAPIHGCKLRIAVSGAYGDYPVDQDTWNAVNDILQEGRHTANKSVEVTPTTVTPAADAPVAPVAGVPHH